MKLTDVSPQPDIQPQEGECWQHAALRYYREEEKDEIADWLNCADLSLSRSIVSRIPYRIAQAVIEKYEYLGDMPGWTSFTFGHFFNCDAENECGRRLGGALAFGNTTGSYNSFTTSLQDLDLIQLQRGVSLWWTPSNAASFFISKACKWLSKHTDFDGVTATADERANEIGTIYQALNWTYLGAKVHGSKRFIIDGNEIHPKTLYDRHGTSEESYVRELYGDRLEVKRRMPKHRYVWVFDPDKRPRSKPYPKRSTPYSEYYWMENSAHENPNYFAHAGVV